MTRFLGLMCAVALVLVASNSARADEGQISQAQLSELGLGGMEMVSDAEGTKIRGKFLWSLNANSTAIRTYLTLLPISPATANYFLQTVLIQNQYFATLFPGTIYSSPINHVIK